MKRNISQLTAMCVTVVVALMATINMAEAAHVSDIIIPVEEETKVTPHITLNITEATEAEFIEPLDESTVTVIETPTEAYTEPETEAETQPAKLVQLSSSDEQMLLKIAMAEAESQGVTGKALVMRVVLNRVQSAAWPNSVYDVIYQKGQFSPISDGRYNKVTPNNECYEALAMIEAGWDESQGAQYFCRTGSSRWHETHLTKLFTNGNHTFYK